MRIYVKFSLVWLVSRIMYLAACKFDAFTLRRSFVKREIMFLILGVFLQCCSNIFQCCYNVVWTLALWSAYNIDTTVRQQSGNVDNYVIFTVVIILCQDFNVWHQCELCAITMFSMLYQCCCNVVTLHNFPMLWQCSHNIVIWRSSSTLW